MKEKFNDGKIELKPSLSIPEYRNQFGFDLKKAVAIYQSRKLHQSGQDWFAFQKKSLEELFTVQTIQENSKKLQVVFIVETIKTGRVYCHLILSDHAFKEMLNDPSQHILQVHQMYRKFFSDHVLENLEN